MTGTNDQAVPAPDVPPSVPLVHGTAGTTGVPARYSTAWYDLLSDETKRNAAPVPGANVVHLGDQVQDWVDAAVRANHAGRDVIYYDVSLAAVPTNVRQHVTKSGQVGVNIDTSSVYLFTVFMPSVIVGHAPYSTVKILGDYPSKEMIAAVVKESLAELHVQRGKDLSL